MCRLFGRKYCLSQCTDKGFLSGKCLGMDCSSLFPAQAIEAAWPYPTQIPHEALLIVGPMAAAMALPS